MTTENRLGRTAPNGLRSGKTAMEWAQSARDRNLLDQAAKWERAAREGWDDAHFDLGVREEMDRVGREWAAGKRTR